MDTSLGTNGTIDWLINKEKSVNTCDDWFCEFKISVYRELPKKDQRDAKIESGTPLSVMGGFRKFASVTATSWDQGNSKQLTLNPEKVDK